MQEVKKRNTWTALRKKEKENLTKSTAKWGLDFRSPDFQGHTTPHQRCDHQETVGVTNVNSAWAAHPLFTGHICQPKPASPPSRPEETCRRCKTTATAWPSWPWRFRVARSRFCYKRTSRPGKHCPICGQEHRATHERWGGKILSCLLSLYWRMVLPVPLGHNWFSVVTRK